MKPTIKVTARQIRFLLDSGGAWMIQPLHVSGGIPVGLRGFYAVPLKEERQYQWGALDAKTELATLRDWVAKGLKQ